MQLPRTINPLKEKAAQVPHGKAMKEQQRQAAIEQRLIRDYGTKNPEIIWR